MKDASLYGSVFTKNIYSTHNEKNKHKLQQRARLIMLCDIAIYINVGFHSKSVGPPKKYRVFVRQK